MKIFRKYKFDVMLIGALLFAIFSITLYFIIYNYYEGLATAKKGVFNRLRAIANTSAEFIDGDLHESLTSAYTCKNDIRLNVDDPAYFTLHLQLQKIQKRNHLESAVYTLVYNEQKNIFEFVVTSSIKPYFRHPYVRFPEKLMADYRQGGILDLYQSENGIWLSAFAPIKNSADKVVGVVEVDQNFESFIKDARANLLRQSAISLLVILPFSILLFRFVKQVLNSHKEYEHELAEKSEEINTQNEVIKKAFHELEKTKDRIVIQNHFLEKTVRERTSKLRQSNRDLSRFLYHSSHDIQAPLASLKGLLHIISLDTKDYPMIEQFQQAINRLERMTKTVQSIYTVKTQAVRKKATNIMDLIKTVTSRFDSQEIRFDFHNLENVVVWSDHELLRQALFELIKNAHQYHDFTRGACTLTIVALPAITNKTKLIITDNGPGIPNPLQKNIFSKFQRGDVKSDGVGLGLYIAKTALTRFGGTIELIESNKNGTSFLVELPLYDDFKATESIMSMERQAQEGALSLAP